MLPRLYGVVALTTTLLLYTPLFGKCGLVMLESITLYEKHGLWWDPTVYFYCNGENKTILPDVHTVNQYYNFSGHESWQPLTSLDGEKCKRCGFYESNRILGDSKFDEWELCPLYFQTIPSPSSDTSSMAAVYNRFVPGSINVSFICQDCNSKASPQSNHSANYDGIPNELDGPIWFQSKLDITIFVLVLLAFVLAMAGLICVLRTRRWWPWKRNSRCEDTVRFMQLFDEDDEFEDELNEKL